MGQTIKNLFYVLLLLSVIVMAGCGVGHFKDDEGFDFESEKVLSSDSSDFSVPTTNLPAKEEFETVSFNKAINEVLAVKNIQSSALAIDIPIGYNYFLNVVNKGNIEKKVNVFSDVNASIRPYNQKESYDSKIYASNNDELAQKASYEARVGFARASSAKNGNSLNFARQAYMNAISDHSKEVVGQEYCIYTGTLNVKPVTALKRCKLVAVTQHVKFFVDQENHGYTDYDPAKMESWVTGNSGSYSLANIFDTYTYGNVSGYSVLEENFGTVADIDNDGKLSILFSPILQVWSNGLEGLFPEETMMPDSGSYSNLPALPEYRDLVIVGPIRHNNENYCKHRILLNMIHETQHAINFCYRAYSGNVYNPGYDSKCFAEELGFDEGCSVCAEALFRRAWGNAGLPTLYDFRTGGVDTEYTGNDNRFNNYLRGDNAITFVYPFNNFDYGKDYGRNGLFMLYIYDRFGKDSFKRLINQGWQGNNLYTAIPMILCGNNTSFEDIFRDWIFALQNEYLRSMQNRKGEFMTSNVRFKYADWLKLTSVNKSVNSNPTNLGLNYGIMYLLEPAVSNIDNNGEKRYRFFVKSDSNQTLEDLEVNVIKLPNN